MPAPPILEQRKKTKSNDYRIKEVVERVRDDFKNKCYICEYKAPPTINVEHFIPHRGNRDLMFDWNNLYYACGHCNNLKSHIYDDILNCLNPDDDVENRIHLKMEALPFKNVEVKARVNDSRTLKTKELLNLVYNGSTTIKTVEAQNLRKILLYDLLNFQKKLFEYYELDEDDEDKVDIKKEITRHLKSSSAFTAFKRWIIKDTNQYMEDFGYTFEAVQPSNIG
ncbi:HNH endonuclease [Paenibacillus lautus]|uniref:HNH endonuclease n=1 Tax=Paenibacillus lautus TaxID=1401 RepID=UPI002DBBFF81|nr:hypothetical protein [Paenibacillus lautus]MEC0259736.1 hypothetical protein [Paenibacillus lautus]